MPRSFDVFDRDDFRNPDDLDRGASAGSESRWSARIRRSELHRKEERADARDREDGGRSRQERPPLRRKERVREILDWKGVAITGAGVFETLKEVAKLVLAELKKSG